MLIFHHRQEFFIEIPEFKEIRIVRVPGKDYFAAEVDPGRYSAGCFTEVFSLDVVLYIVDDDRVAEGKGTP